MKNSTIIGAIIYAVGYMAIAAGIIGRILDNMTINLITFIVCILPTVAIAFYIGQIGLLKILLEPLVQPYAENEEQGSPANNGDMNWNIEPKLNIAMLIKNGRLFKDGELVVNNHLYTKIAKAPWVRRGANNALVATRSDLENNGYTIKQ